jgi:hypothetical protein
MIKFFRKIRQNLLMENKTGKYLKYAIGEIVLVVIGILIALQINNWNESRKGSIMGVQFLEGISDDIKKDIAAIDSVMYWNRESFSIISSIDSVFHKNPYYESQKFPHYFGRPDTIGFSQVFHRPNSFRPTIGTYNSLIADGKTTLINNKDLFEKIQRIYNLNHQYVNSNYDVIKSLETSIGWAYPYEKQKWSYIDLKLAKNEKIFYDLVNFTVEKYWYSNNLQRLKENSIEVIALIEKEISND